MQGLTYILFQLDEAIRYIEGGRIEQLRLALLLLDNAAELQVANRVREELAMEGIHERVRQQVLRVAADRASEPPETLRELVEWQPLTPKEKRGIGKYFDAKLRYLSERHKILDPRLGEILSHLHRYRNEAYHQGRVRRDTIRTAGLILLEANCELLLTVYRISSWSSNEDYSWLEGRFDLRGLFFGGAEARQTLVSEIRRRNLPDAQAVAENLVLHLKSRIADIWKNLDFITDNTRLRTRAEALKVAQLAAAVDKGTTHPDTDPRSYEGRWDVEAIRHLGYQVEEIGQSEDRLTAFARFSAVERLIEEVEGEIRPLEEVVDRLVDEEIDRRRGK